MLLPEGLTELIKLVIAKKKHHKLYWYIAKDFLVLLLPSVFSAYLNCRQNPPAPLNVGTPDSALTPAPVKTTTLWAASNLALKAAMSELGRFCDIFDQQSTTILYVE